MRQVGAEQGYSRNAELEEPHDIPRTFDQSEWTSIGVVDSVPPVEELAFRQSRREEPLTLSFANLRTETSSGVSEWPAQRVVKADSDTALEQPPPLVEASLEASGSSGMYVLFAQ